MSNGRSLRRGLKASRQARAAGRWPFGGPSLSSVRRWMRQLEAAGLAERTRAEPDGKPGRPADMWQLTEKGRQRDAANERSGSQQVTDLRVERIMRRAQGKALTEDEIMRRYETAMAPARSAELENQP